MGLFTPKCTHQWNDGTGTFAEPEYEFAGDFQARGVASSVFALKILYGITTVNQRCETCGTSRSYSVAGQAVFPTHRLSVPVTPRPPRSRLARLLNSTCSHEWGPGTGTFSEPEYEFDGPCQVRGSVARTLAFKVLNGISTITQRCVHCNYLTSYTRAGRVELPNHPAFTTERRLSTPR
jgi:hypothetical protein